MGNLATVIQFPAHSAPAKPQEVRVVDLDNGFLRLASELVDEMAKPSNDFSKLEFRILLVVTRKTYGFNKKLDWISGAQFAEATGMTENKARDVVRALVKRRVLVREGRKLGWNTTISEWETKQPKNKVNNPKEGLKNNPKTGFSTTSDQGHTKDNIQKTRKTKDQNTSAEPAIAASTPVVIESVSVEPVLLPAKLSAQQEPVVITMPLNSGEHQVTESFAAQMQALYPAVDVAQELRTMTGWLIANPTKRKTKTGINRFINAWLSKCQDRGGSNGLQAFTPRRNDHTDLTQTMTAAELNQRMREGF